MVRDPQESAGLGVAADAAPWGLDTVDTAAHASLAVVAHPDRPHLIPRDDTAGMVVVAGAKGMTEEESHRLNTD